MPQDKTLPGAPFRFASVSSSGSHINAFGVGEMSLGMYRPGNHWPQVDLGQIYFSAPTPDQYEEAKKLKGSFTKEGVNFSDIHRRISRKQAEYVTYLIVSMLSEKLKGEMPTDDEIDIIMKEAREANYPVNREKREEERKWQLTEKENELLGKLRYECQLKRVEIDMEFDYQIDMSSNKCGNIYLLHYNDINKHFQFTRTESLSKILFDAIQYVSAIKSDE